MGQGCEISIYHLSQDESFDNEQEPPSGVNWILVNTLYTFMFFTMLRLEWRLDAHKPV